MSALLDEAYFQWLYSQVASIRLKSPARTYWSLLGQLYSTEFIWLVANDDNRVEDGRDLRYEFLKDSELEIDHEWVGLGCSMLEMMIGLARRLSFEAEGEPRTWFWIMMENLDIKQFNDLSYNRRSKRMVGGILEAVIFRQYDPTGQGGLFPLNDASKDQTKVELWYQLNTYLLERP